jgi:hypothetical protein
MKRGKRTFRRRTQLGLAAIAITLASFFIRLPIQGQSADVIAEVRAAIAARDFGRGDELIARYRTASGVTPELLEALSWLGRGALAAREWDKAEGYARETYDLAMPSLEGRSVDQDPHLATAVGAAIEVQAHVRAERGERSEAVYFLQRELETYKDTPSTSGSRRTFTCSVSKGNRHRR